jgi:hypothetical protein
VIRDRAEGVDRPSQGVLGGVLADQILTRVHQCGDLRQVRAALRVGDGGDLSRPRTCRDRDESADPISEPRVDDGSQVAGSDQVSLADCGDQDVPGVQPSELRGAQGPP